MKCMFDTNVFNRILDGVIAIEALPGHVVSHATHIQINEINKGRGIEVSDEICFLSHQIASITVDPLPFPNTGVKPLRRF